ncbi:MAG: hypothetical protein JJT94_09385 [Bernardetiaceae bacterium]|nr:hypothetical protein [Bernardetiaceae bacterium]
MTLLKEDKYIKVTYNAATKLLEATWKTESEELDAQGFQNINWFYIECFDTHAIESFLIDATDFRFPITPDLQLWVAQNILTKASELGLSKLAFKVSKEFIAQLSIEQTMHEGKEVGFATHYFSSYEEAVDWLTNAPTKSKV